MTDDERELITRMRDDAAANGDYQGAAARLEHGVDVDPYGGAQVGVGKNTIRISWDDQAGLGQYVVDDRNGD